jgi:1,4-alpha-glucan branching enzyme
MSIKKQYLKSKPVCKVTFRIPKEVANGTRMAALVGEFNNWNPEATLLQQLKTGEFTTTLELEQNRSYQFRYLLDNETWINDEAADSYVSSGFGDKNSVVVL